MPIVPETWRTDEIFTKIRGNKKYYYPIMDNDTRFMITELMAGTKGTEGVKSMFVDQLDSHEHSLVETKGTEGVKSMFVEA